MHSEGISMHKNAFATGAAPDPAGGAYSAPPDLLAGGEGAGWPLTKNPTSALGLWPRFSALRASTFAVVNFL